MKERSRGGERGGAIRKGEGSKETYSVGRSGHA